MSYGEGKRAAQAQAELQHQLATLTQRLDRGLEKIEQARQQGQDCARWEALWLSLLHDYEQTWDRLHTKEA